MPNSIEAEDEPSKKPLSGFLPTAHRASWYAVHTRSRHERKVKDELEEKRFEVFLPEYWSWSKRRDRRKKVLRPLFPGYLFVRCQLSPELRMSILQTRSVARVVGTHRLPVPIPDHQVESVRRLLSGSPDAGPCEAVGSGYSSGQLVQVMDGPLRGVIGTVLTETKKKKIVVTVDLLGRAVSATIETDSLAPYLDSPT